MNDIYNGQQCPVCHARFFEEDDVVHCPICGAPHHRECWKMTGRCAHEATHGTPQQWTAQQTKAKSPNNVPPPGPEIHDNTKERPNINDNICPSCRKSIPKDSLFCPNCGHDFVSGDFNQGNRQYYAQQGFFPNPMYAQAGYAPADPLGGIDENEKIEDIPVKKVAKFVGINSRRYIPIFAKKNSKGKAKKLGWNWAAFLIPQYWMVYRKCYAASIFAFVFSLIGTLCTVPIVTAVNTMIPENASVSYNDLFAVIYNNIDRFSYAAIYLALASLAIQLIIRIIYAVFGDYFYRVHCINKIGEIDEKNDSITAEELYPRKGNVSPIATAVSYMLFNMIYMIAMSFI